MQKTKTKNDRLKQALGIRSIQFRSYGGNNRWLWDVFLQDGTSILVTVPNLASESTVLKGAAEKLAKMGRAVEWPQ